MVAAQQTCKGSQVPYSPTEAHFGTLPPAFIADETGRPVHSWRVLLLPYLDELPLYLQYNFDLPFDHPQNQQLQGQMPAVFACPLDPLSASLGETNYVVVTGSATLFPGTSSRSSVRVSDDPATTILLAEVHEQGIDWLAPLDLNLQEMQTTLRQGSTTGPSHEHQGAARVLTLDGNVRTIRSGVPADLLQAMTTIAGGERLSGEALYEAELGP